MLKNTARYEGLLLVAVVVLSVAVLFAPALYRHANLLGYPMGTEPYREAAIASQGGPESTPYSILLSLLSPSILKSSAFVPQLLGGVSLLALWGILRQLNLPPELRLGSLALLALSPAFIYTFAVSNQYALLIALALSGIFFLVRGSPVSDRKSVV